MEIPIVGQEGRIRVFGSNLSLSPWTIPAIHITPLHVDRANITTSNMIFSVTCYLIYMVLYLFTIEICFYQVKLSMFYNVQTTTVTFVGKI